MRAWIKVNPETGEQMGYSEGAVGFDANGDEIPLTDICAQGFLQIEVEPGGSWRDQFDVDLTTMIVTRTPADTSGDISDQDDPAFVAIEGARKATAQERIAALGRPINTSTRISPKKQAQLDREANDGG